MSRMETASEAGGSDAGDLDVVGIDVGGTNIKVVGAATGEAVAGGENRLGRWRSFSCPTGASDPPGTVVERIAAAVGRMAGGKPAAVGLALPGNVDAGNGTALYVPALGEDWAGYAVADRLGERVGAPVVLVNDVHAMTVAEATLGAARGAADVLCVAVGTGVGGGLVLGGQPRTDVTGTGSIGHTTVEPDGPVCVCGNRGCVESYASGPAIAAYAGLPTAASVAAAAGRGEPAAVAAYALAGRYLGIAVANVVTMISPSHVVVGGGVAGAGDLLLDPLRAELRQRVRVASLVGTQVVSAGCGTEAGALGAALRATVRIRSQPASTACVPSVPSSLDRS